MLFKSSEYRYCVNCAHAAELDEEHMICKKKGTVSKDKRCLSFSYDPLKRDPALPQKVQFSKWKSSDFSLE